MKVAEHIKIDGTVTKVVPENGSTFTLGELQGYVGGYVEPVRCIDGRLALVDEDGLMKSLAHNEVASVLCGRPIVGDTLALPDDMMR